MCGIVAYIGEKDINQVILNSLSRLEYRGYDSAGMAVIEDKKMIIHKEQGKLSELRQIVEGEPPSKAHIGIGHTRWATHGKPTRQNAHPHTSFHGGNAVVHNGIIENYDTIRSDLELEGYKFSSDTDTETIVQLIDKFVHTNKLTLTEATFETVKRINGSYAFCVISEQSPDQILVARNGSPLIIGVGDGENFVASDVPAILEHTRRVIYLDDFELAKITKDSIEVYDIDGNVIKKEIKAIEWTSEEAEKGGYQHFMLKEIEEQPGVVDKIIKTRVTDVENIKIIDEGQLEDADIAAVEKIIIQACGTSWHAALFAKYIFEEFANIACEVDVSSEFRYRTSVFSKGTLLITISQSGETIDALMGMRKAKEAGVMTYSLCNVVGSTITRESDCVTYLLAGPEISVASTKAYTAQLTNLFLLCFKCALVRGTLSKKQVAAYVDELSSVSSHMRNIIEGRDSLKDIADKYAQFRDFIFLARGYNYPSVMEGALKIKEIAYLHATGHPAGEMKHGPIALIDDNIPIVCVLPESLNYEKMLSNVREVAARNGIIVGVITEGDEQSKAFLDDVITIPHISELFSPLLVVLCFQYLAYFVAVARGQDVDQPRNLAKSVTVE
ncbi:glutamine--fructose-6-phosphate transaminase (isomerizing) [Candidatus Omnitrophota bacterium]